MVKLYGVKDPNWHEAGGTRNECFCWPFCFSNRNVFTTKEYNVSNDCQGHELVRREQSRELDGVYGRQPLRLQGMRQTSCCTESFISSVCVLIIVHQARFEVVRGQLVECHLHGWAQGPSLRWQAPNSIPSVTPSDFYEIGRAHV